MSAAPLTAATAATSPAPLRLEQFRELWQRQLITDRKMPPSALKVAIAIGWYLNRKKGWAWPGIARLAKDTGLSSRTVIRAVAYLEGVGHSRVLRTRAGKINGANRYRPILKVPSVSKRGPHAGPVCHGCQGGSDKALSGGSDKAMSPEPLNEPLNRTSILIEATSSDVAHRGDRKRVGEEGSEAKGGECFIAQPNAEAQCYRLARDLAGERGAALITRALESDAAETVLDDLREAQQSGEDIGYVLWRP